MNYIPPHGLNSVQTFSLAIPVPLVPAVAPHIVTLTVTTLINRRLCSRRIAVCVHHATQCGLQTFRHTL